MPEPNSSALPISLKTLAITGFLGNGEKLSGSNYWVPCDLFAFSVETFVFSITNFAGKGFVYSR